MIAPADNSTPSIIAPEYIYRQEDCRLTIKFPLKIIAATQANFTQRVLRVNEENYALSASTIIKELLYQKLFLRLQVRSKKWFTSIYFWQISTKPCQTPVIREQLSLNASWFSCARTQKIQLSGKIESEKNTKKLHSKY